MIILLNKLPVPNLKHYCLVSFSLLAFVLIYAQKLLHDIKNSTYKNDKFEEYTEYLEQNGNLMTTYRAVIIEPWCLWVTTL